MLQNITTIENNDYKYEFILNKNLTNPKLLKGSTYNLGIVYIISIYYTYKS